MCFVWGSRGEWSMKSVSATESKKPYTIDSATESKKPYTIDADCVFFATTQG